MAWSVEEIELASSLAGFPEQCLFLIALSGCRSIVQEGHLPPSAVAQITAAPQ